METVLQYCLIIPHYNHSREFADFLPQLLALSLPCIVVDDGSNPEQVESLEKTLTPHKEIYLIKHPQNRGKGAAVFSAVHHARTLGMSHVFQVDADGQHNASDIPQFIELSKQQPNKLICGRPVFDDDAPKARVYGRKVTDVLVALETLSMQIKDSLCGFRIYPIRHVETIMDRYYLGPRMDFDTEILVKAAWQNMQFHFVDTKVKYLEQGASHFHYLRDNLLLIRLHARLLCGMLIRLPLIIFRKFSS